MLNLTFCLFHYFPFGGSQRNFLKIAKACQARGHRVTVYTQSWEGDLPPEFELHCLPGRGWQHYQRNRDFIHKVQHRLKNQPRTFVIGFNRMPGLDLCYIADTCFAAKLATEKPFFYRYLLPRYRAYLRAEQAVFEPKQQTHIFFLCDKQQQHYQQYYPLSSDRYTVLPPAIHRFTLTADEQAIARQTIRTQLQLPSNTYLLLMVGSSFNTKGVDRTLHTLAYLQQQHVAAHVVVIGRGKIAAYQKLARRLGVAHACHFLGTRDDVPQYLAAADLLIHPARVENTGNALLEALSAGSPVLVTENCGFAFHVKQAHAGDIVTLPFDQTAMNQQTLAMLNDQILKQYQQHALEYAATHDLYSMVPRAVAMIEKLAAQALEKQDQH